jgi:hypothetical protein
MTGKRNFTSGSLDALLPLLSGTSASVRRSVACAFASVGAIEDRRVIDALLKSLGDTDWVIWGMASSALASAKCDLEIIGNRIEMLLLSTITQRVRNEICSSSI